MSSKEDIFYTNLEHILAKESSWPHVYLFKFIVPSENIKICAVEEAFKEINQAQISKNFSKNKNYISISVEAKMNTPRDIIDKYKKLSLIEGIISL